MKTRRWIVATLGWFAMASDCFAQDSARYRIDGGLFYLAFQQQVKAVVGDPRGERLVNHEEIGIMMMGTASVWRFISAGLFFQYDRGNRHAARFAGFNAEGRTITRDKIGGFFNEFWMGPILRVQYINVFGELGYGLIGIRDDDARRDLPSSTGDTEGAFTVSPRIAWYAALGAGVPLASSFDVVFRVEYRLRYYHERGGNPLIDNIEHGTQNISPFIGIAWRR